MASDSGLIFASSFIFFTSPIFLFETNILSYKSVVFFADRKNN
ncbi:Uncharacterized protein dnm_099780 [Desulfonema magnum]|uniref:Uncharacterized protein n=1 Tax=Desulfonema magnum TaxID=45655 RepID=A0A975GU75_9BACT|nr:Uncharacterized protein dnm_099780 [Desulfonema magnum]